jgi:hypothetical protein
VRFRDTAERRAPRRDAAEQDLVNAKCLSDKDDFLIHRVVLHFSMFRHPDAAGLHRRRRAANCWA